MSLAPGDKLGPYEIVEAIGKGGMGEVFRARDTRLGRDVAVKVSAQAFGERFEREARAIASLNHPNICTLHDVGPNYLVMELVEGPTLAERIKEGPIPLEEALGIARQMADALEAAHEKGITHRDLKPGNVKVRPDGSVKVLDFGLAKVGPRADASGEESPTLSMHATQAGVILGTAAYMAPEQARGKVVDKRADIWAFGVVLYEMVTGKRLFQGEDLTDILATVVKIEPDLSDAPPQLHRLLKKCLEKDPRKRLRDISGVALFLEEDGAAGPQAGSAAEPPRAGKKWLWPAVAAALAVIAAAGYWAPWRASQPEDRPLVRLNVDLGPTVSLAEVPLAAQSIALTPDGSRLVYVASVSGGPSRVYVQRLDQTEPVALQGTEGANSVFLSPDGRWVGFYTGNSIRKISIEGGAVASLVAQTTTYAGAAWGEDGSIIFSLAVSGGLMTVPEGGGEPVPLLPLAEGELAFRSPQILPGGKAVLFTATQGGLGGDATNLDVFSLADHVRKTIVRGGSSGLYVPSGYLVYNTRGTLFAIPFDPERLETRGSAIPVEADLAYNPTTAFANIAFSRNGTLIYRTSGGGESAQSSTVQWMDSAGVRKPLIATPGVYDFVRLSPDARKVGVTTSAGGNQRLSVYDPERDNLAALTFENEQVRNAVWTPDGRFLLFGVPGLGISSVRADGAGQPVQLMEIRTLARPYSFTPDGNHLAYVSVLALENILTVPVTEDGGQLKAGSPEPFLETPSSEEWPRFSRDGRWLAYQSDESGRYEVSVRAFPRPSSGEGAKFPISTSGGVRPVWSRSANELYYQAGDQIMAVRYRAEGDQFVAERPRVWGELRGATLWDMGPDGRAVIAAPVEITGKQQGLEPQRHIVFLQNFFDELRRRVPVDGN